MLGKDGKFDEDSSGASSVQHSSPNDDMVFLPNCCFRRFLMTPGSCFDSLQILSSNIATWEATKNRLTLQGLDRASVFGRKVQQITYVYIYILYMYIYIIIYIYIHTREINCVPSKAMGSKVG